MDEQTTVDHISITLTYINSPNDLCLNCGAYWDCECPESVLLEEPRFMPEHVWDHLNRRRLSKSIDWTGGGMSAVWTTTDPQPDDSYATFPPIT